MDTHAYTQVNTIYINVKQKSFVKIEYNWDLFFPDIGIPGMAFKTPSNQGPSRISHFFPIQQRTLLVFVFLLNFQLEEQTYLGLPMCWRHHTSLLETHVAVRETDHGRPGLTPSVYRLSSHLCGLQVMTVPQIIPICRLENFILSSSNFPFLSHSF